MLWGGQRFWEIPLALQDDLIDAGLRLHFVVSRFAAPVMIEQESGLIINVASHAACRGESSGGSGSIVPYTVGKTGLHRLNARMATELRELGVAVIEIWPPATRTDGVLAQADVFGDLGRWKPPLLTGRVVAALITHGDALARSGKALVVTELADALGVTG